MKSRKINKEEEQEICKSYLNNEAINDIAIKHHLGAIKIRQILKENKIEVLDKSLEKAEKRCEKERDLEKCEKGYHAVAICKLDGKRFNDVMNYGGFLTKHLRDIHKIEIPSYYARRQYFLKNHTYWYEEYFDIIQEKDMNLPIKQCPYCSWVTTDIENKSGAFVVHLKNKHNLSKEEHLRKHPEDIPYFEMANKTANLQHSIDEDDYVVCQICGKRLRRIDHKHLASHGITQEEYIAKYGNNTLAKHTIEKLQVVANKMNQTLAENPHFTSSAETEIIDYLSTFGIEGKKDRKLLNGQELDIYISSKNLAIEYNGIVWHSVEFGGKTKEYHLDKTIACNEKGVRLIHIFEDDYANRKEVVKSMLLRCLGILPKTNISGHKCVIKHCSCKTAKQFIEENTLDKIDERIVNDENNLMFSAVFNDILCGILICCKISEDEFEVKYACSHKDYNCHGVIGKLIKHFVNEQKPKILIMKLDRSKVSEKNNIAITLGFEFAGYEEPQMWRVNKKEHRPNRFYATSWSMDDKCNTIYDCGNIVYKKTL